MQTINVIDAKYVEGCHLSVTFSDDTCQLIDFRPALERLRVPEYRQYLKPEYFQQFHIEDGNVVWGEDWDIIFPVDQLYHNKIR